MSKIIGITAATPTKGGGGTGSTAIYDGKVTVSGRTGDLGSNPPLFVRNKYKVVFDGAEYECVFKNNGYYSYLGNGSMLLSSIEDTGEPFCVGRAAHATLLVASEGEHTLTIMGNELPEVTPDDNGKVPKVKGGVWGLGVTSWNELSDRPFGEEVSIVQNTLTWDGTPSGTIIALEDPFPFSYHHVSNSTPTADELVGSDLTLFNGETHVPMEGLPAEAIQQTTDDVLAVVEEFPYIFVVSKDGAVVESLGETVVFEKKGIYFAYIEIEGQTAYISSLTIEGYTFEKVALKTIDEKYLPRSIWGTSGSIRILAENWDINKQYALDFPQLGDHDAIFFKPKTKEDKAMIDAAKMFVSAEGQTVTFTVETPPAADCYDLDYFIARGV